MKKVILVLLIIVTTTVIFPVFASATETFGDYEYTVGDDGTAMITKYIGNGGDIEIPSELDGYAVTNIGEKAFYKCESLTTVTIPDRVTHIGLSVFEECTSLTSITIPDSVIRIGGGTFIKCTSLTSVVIPKGVTRIEPHTFKNCTKLASVTIPNSVTDISGFAFYECTSLTSIIIPDRVTNIGTSAFYECKSLTSITIPYGVISIKESTFSFCDSLTTVRFNNPYTEIPTDGSLGGRFMEGAFYSCLNLKTVYGYSGSTAESFSKRKTPANKADYDMNFIPLLGVNLNEKLLAFDVLPIMENDRVLVPFRAIFEALNANVEWDGDTQTVTAIKDDITIELQIDNDTMTVNGEAVTLDVPPQIKDERTLVPIRAISEGLGANVDWNQELQLVVITTK